MKVLTVLGTRPEIIRLCRVIARLDDLCDHVLVHTGQNHDPALSDGFFDELGVRAPDHQLGVRSDTVGGQIAQILVGVERVIESERPDRILVLGDTNSALSAVIGKRRRVLVCHMEAGNRCFDDRVPEEVNRRIVDHCSDVLMPYTERSRANLLREGISSDRIFVTGNPIWEVIRHHENRIASSDALPRLGLAPRSYLLATMHRAENVDVPERLDSLVASLAALGVEHDLPVVVSTHPRTRAHLAARYGGAPPGDVRYLPPFGFADFVALERGAYCVLTDSGTVQEECALFGVPNVTLRDTTERPETVESGANILSGVCPATIARCVRVALSRDREPRAPVEYTAEHVSQTVTNIVLGHHRGEMP